MWKCILCGITLLILSVCGEITVTNNAYEGIVIAIGEDLEETDCNSNFNLIKGMLTSASELLYNATGNQLSLGEVTVVVPVSWTCDGNASQSEGIMLSEAHVRIGPSHPVFGNSPWTQQPRGCGEQGDFIYMSEGYLKSPSEMYGTTAKVFVQEWAKFRWGVFEESGHSGDAMFPPSYHTKVNDSLTLLPNYCTDQEIIGEQSSCTNNTAEKDCLFTPSTNGNNDGITSSLLSVPFLKNVVQFCDSSTHNSNVPSKHNFLCGGKSVWDVIKNSTDISETKSLKNIRSEPKIRLLRAASPFVEKIVIAMEHSKQTAENVDTWEFLRDTVKQFIEVKVKSGAEVGLIIFNDAVHTASNLTVLSNRTERLALSSLVPDDTSDSVIAKDLTAIISTAASLLSKDGVIILMTANQETINMNSNDLNALALAADGNSVWPILYPHKSGEDTNVYETLAQRTNGHAYIITGEIYGSPVPFQKVTNYYDMSSRMLEIQSNTSSGEALFEIASGSCGSQVKNCNVLLQVDDPELYEDEVIVEMYSATFDGSKAVFENPTDTETIAEFDSYIAYKINGSGISSYTVNVTRNFMGGIVKVTLLAKNKVQLSDYTLIVTASPSLEDLQYTPKTAPIIYAQITKNWDFVYYASVTATVNGQNTILHDDGVGADLTGNDGIYSAYLLGISATGNIDMAISVDDNNGKAQIAGIQNKAVPSKPEDKWCCGSEIDLSDVNLVPALNLNVTSAIIRGTVTGDPGQDLPPGSVNDLTADVVGTSDGAQITLHFTATGDNLDQGIVDNYIVKSDQNDEHTCNNDDNAVSGTMVTCSFVINIPDQDTLYTYQLVAVDENANEGKPSNEVRVFVSAKIPIPNSSQPLTGGAIAGIVIGVLLFIVLVVLGVLLFLGKDEKEDNLAWNIVCCKVCKKEEEDNIYNKDPPTSARSNDVTRNPTVEPIRSIEDLYAKPDMDAKKRNQAEKTKDEHDDGGFTTHRSRSNDIPLQTNYSVNNTLERGSQQNLPINQVGIPIAENPSLQRNQRGTQQSYDRNTYNQRHNPNQDYRGVNNGYDASYDYGTNNSQPQTGRAPRTLTQV